MGLRKDGPKSQDAGKAEAELRVDVNEWIQGGVHKDKT
jgi:hypothetical protein